MTTKRRVVASIGCVLLLMAALYLAACSRAPATVTDPGGESSDPEAGGAAGADSGPQTPVPTATATREASPRLDGTPLPAATATTTATATMLATNTPVVPTAAPPTVATTAAPTTAAPSTSTPPATRPAPLATPTPGGERVHVVQAGENLYRIGLLYGLSWVAIAEYNGITDPNAITVGQELRIPPSPTATPEGQTFGPTTDGRPPTAAEQSPAEQGPGSRGQGPGEESSALEPGPLPLEPSPPAVGGQPSVVVVAAGDTLYAISRQYGVNWAQIAEANGLATPNHLYPGQLLKIPPDVPGPTPEFNHRVHSGETLSKLAQQYGLSADELAAANGLSAPYVIYSGQTLVIPSDE